MKVSPGVSMVAKYSSSSPNEPAALPGQANLQQRHFDDGADIHPGDAGHAVGAYLHPAIGAAEQLAIAVIGGESIAAILDELEHVLEGLAGQGRRRGRRG